MNAELETRSAETGKAEWLVFFLAAGIVFTVIGAILFFLLFVSDR